MAGIGISYLVNILLIVHALRTGRPFMWIFIILIPVIGPISYIVVELLPELANDYRAKRALRGIRRTIDPNADLRRHQRQDKLSGSVDAKRHLAAELDSDLVPGVRGGRLGSDVQRPLGGHDGEVGLEPLAQGMLSRRIGDALRGEGVIVSSLAE